MDTQLRSLLESAARAVGMQTRWDPVGPDGAGYLRARLPGQDQTFPIWRPHLDDGDALRLAVLAGYPFEIDPVHECDRDDYASDPGAATRMAIIRTVAGKAPL